MIIEEQSHQPQRGLKFEDVWAMFQESQAEHDRMIADADKRSLGEEKRFQKMFVWVKQITQNVYKLSKLVNKITQNVDKLSELVYQLTRNVDKLSARVNQLTQHDDGFDWSTDELIETLIAVRFWEKFAAYPYCLQRAYQRVPVYGEGNKLKTDIDILLSDTEWCMAVEVKREADDRDVDRLLGRMELIRQYPPLEVQGKRLLGALVSEIVSPDTVEYAHKAGFFVLILTGESVTLLETPADFVAKEW